MTAADVAVRSERLHAKVRAFAAGDRTHSFDELALEIARFQALHSPSFARLVALHGAALDDVDRIPAVPTDAFRLTRVAVHAERDDTARFYTSGTTEETRGAHVFRTIETYAELATAFGRAALIPSGTRPLLVALAAPPTSPPSSSLTFMMELFMKRLQSPGEARWLLGPQGPDLDGLERAAAQAEASGSPLVVLSTSLALLAVLRALDGRILRLPRGSVVMQTGGYKGQHVSVGASELRRDVARAFTLEERAVVSEYGMTELTSQLYEGTAPGVRLSGPPNVYLAPEWLRVTPVDPVSLTPAASGEIGLARFVDLGNVDSAVAIVTRDRIRANGPGFELLGREPGAAPRGCSLAVEALLGAQNHAFGRL